MENLAPFTGRRPWHLPSARSPATYSLENLARGLPTGTVFTTRSFSHFALAAISGRLWIKSHSRRMTIICVWLELKDFMKDFRSQANIKRNWFEGNPEEKRQELP